MQLVNGGIHRKAGRREGFTLETRNDLWRALVVRSGLSEPQIHLRDGVRSLRRAFLPSRLPVIPSANRLALRLDPPAPKRAGVPDLPWEPRRYAGTPPNAATPAGRARSPASP